MKASLGRFQASENGRRTSRPSYRRGILIVPLRRRPFSVAEFGKAAAAQPGLRRVWLGRLSQKIGERGHFLFAEFEWHWLHPLLAKGYAALARVMRTRQTSGPRSMYSQPNCPGCSASNW